MNLVKRGNNKMFNRAKKVFNSKIQEQQEEKKKIEESNKAYEKKQKNGGIAFRGSQ